MTGRDAARARHFRYAGLDVTRDALVGHYDLDGRAFSESVTFDVDGDLRAPAARAIAYLWYLVAGLSYYKLGAPATVDLGATEVGPRGRDLLAAALVDGLGEFAFRNGLVLDDVELTGGAEPARTSGDADPGRVLVPFGGGIDSLVALESLAPVDQALFIVSPAAGRFAAIESSASLTGRSVVRATRRLDPELASAAGFAGHVPVTAMVALLGAVAAAASGRGGVVMSNERSASVPNLTWRGREVNHQWSKSLAAEDLVALAVDDAADGAPLVASVLRDRTELWVASRFAELSDYHDVFRSCNRAFAQDPARRATTWCLECDKCLFVALVLAPFLSRAALAHALGGEPLADARRLAQLEVLVGLGETAKPFECVGDPTESAVALGAVVASDEWRDVAALAEVAARAPATRSVVEMLHPQGETRAPVDWLR